MKGVAVLTYFDWIDAAFWFLIHPSTPLPTQIPRGGGWSAAAAWAQTVVVPNSYWYNIISGKVTGNMVGINDAFVDFKTVLHSDT